ncbi:hypothetical protein BB558_006010 [Smittium angustum]|uniref:Carbonic anhydrase n=1 Tax=Smittium angustum TaxID=133377 RepID=A0A2U1IYV9_SMIAN|nr:hypothetical protein BB558_006010 [Smittium angustum]
MVSIKSFLNVVAIATIFSGVNAAPKCVKRVVDCPRHHLTPQEIQAIIPAGNHTLTEMVLEYNKIWSNDNLSFDPNYFKNFTGGQHPGLTWIGCSDSRVASDTLSETLPGQIFTHRNIANSVSEDDINSLAVLQYTIEDLKVQDIVISGHTYCGGINAAMDAAEFHGPIAKWIKPIADLYEANRAQIDALSPGYERNYALGKLNVKRVVDIVGNLEMVKKAREEGQIVRVHGWMYHMETGLIEDLKVTNE